MLVLEVCVDGVVVSSEYELDEALLAVDQAERHKAANPDATITILVSEGVFTGPCVESGNLVELFGCGPRQTVIHGNIAERPMPRGPRPDVKPGGLPPAAV